MTIVRKLMMNSQLLWIHTSEQYFKYHRNLLQNFISIPKHDSIVIIILISFNIHSQYDQVFVEYDKNIKKQKDCEICCRCHVCGPVWFVFSHLYFHSWSFFCYLHYDQFIIFIRFISRDTYRVMQKLNLRHYIVLVVISSSFLQY